MSNETVSKTREDQDRPQSKWEDPAIPAGDSPPLPVAPLWISTALWIATIAVLAVIASA